MAMLKKKQDLSDVSAVIAFRDTDAANSMASAFDDAFGRGGWAAAIRLHWRRCCAPG